MFDGTSKIILVPLSEILDRLQDLPSIHLEFRPKPHHGISAHSRLSRLDQIRMYLKLRLDPHYQK